MYVHREPPTDICINVVLVPLVKYNILTFIVPSEAVVIS